MSSEASPHRLPKRQLERWREEQRKKMLRDPKVLVRATRSKLAPVPVQGAGAVLGSLPPLCERSAPRAGILVLSRPEKRRNDFLGDDEALRRERQAQGRAQRAKEVAAAQRIQAVYRHWKGIAKMANLASDLQQRMREKAELAAREQKERELQTRAEKWLREISELPPSPLRDTLATLTSKEDPFELHMVGWQGCQTETLDALAVFSQARALSLQKCGLGSRRKLSERVCLAHNLADAICAQLDLVSLSLRESKLEAAELRIVLGAMAYSCSKNLRALDLFGNWLGRGPWDGADEAGNPTFEKDTEAAIALGRVVRACPALKELNMGRNFMGPAAYTAFVNNQAFCRPRALVHIDLGHNALGDRLSAAPYSLAHMIGACPALAALNLEANTLGAHALAIIIKSIALHRSLRSLNLADNRLGDRGAALLCQALKSSRTLARLCLAGNEFSELAYEQIGRALSQSPPRQFAHLDLSRNPLRDQDACTRAMEAMAEVIRANSRLRSLALRRIELVRFRKTQPAHRKAEIRCTLHPATVLMSTLEHNRGLHLLDLSGNRLDEDVAFPASLVANIVRERVACRPALRFARQSQELVAALFKKYLTDPPDPRATARGGLIDRIVFRILAFAVDQRTILI